MRPALFLGLGNPLRRDDGAGPAVAARVAGHMPEEVEVRTLAGEAIELLDAWTGRERVIVVDAVCSGAPPGTVHRLDATDAPLPAVWASLSSHGLGLAAAIELSRALGRLPGRLLIYGIEGEDFLPGDGLTPAVESAVETVAATLVPEAAPIAENVGKPTSTGGPS